MAVHEEARGRGLRHREPRVRRFERLTTIFVGPGLVVVFLLLGREARRGQVFGWDHATWRFLHGHEERAHGSILDHAGNAIVQFGGNNATLLLGLLILAILLGLRRMGEAFFVVTAAAAILALTPLLKEHFERTDLKYSFPSGHSARSATLVTAAIVVAWPTRFRWPTLILGVVFAVSLGTALVYEDWHLPSDVLGGWCLGIACAGAIRIGLTTLARRRRRPPPTDDGGPIESWREP
jgi:membrane-associated phospholipid phosphatase